MVMPQKLRTQFLVKKREKEMLKWILKMGYLNVHSGTEKGCFEGENRVLA